ncbi:MAG: hypothetical protein GX891_04765, partial [Clostridiales bacterium]|nr:hypothetical protein [Clostridiales bacterium]
MTGKRVLLLVICILLALSTAAMFTACDDKPSAPQTKGAVYEEFYTPTKNKAMILIPGLMASSLYKLDDGKPVWGVDGFLNLADEYSKSLDSINRQYPDGSDPSSPNHEEYSKKIARALQDIIVKYLSCDEDGTPVTALRVANMHSSEKFGSFEGMGYLFDILFKNYRNQYDIIVWQYDWRDSNVKAASQLERFINQCGYEKVQFYTHSMGGIVVANYLKSAANREKVELFMPFGAPFLGSMDAVSNLFSSAALDALKDFDFLFGDVDLTEVTRSMPSIYELLPFPQYFTTPTYDGGNSPIFIEDEAVTYERFYEYLCSLDWTKKSDGSLKPFVKGLLDYQSGFFKKASYDSASKRYYEDPNGQYTVHVTQLVPTEYIVGVGVPTIVNVGIVDGELDPDGYGYDYTEFDARGSIY